MNAFNPRERPCPSNSHDLDSVSEHRPTPDWSAGGPDERRLPTALRSAERSSLVWKWQFEEGDDSGRVVIRLSHDITEPANAAFIDGTEKVRLTGRYTHLQREVNWSYIALRVLDSKTWKRGACSETLSGRRIIAQRRGWWYKHWLRSSGDVTTPPYWSKEVSQVTRSQFTE